MYKIIVTGPFNSGKTQFIQTISDIPVVSTERKVTTEDRGIKAETTVAMDYGRVKLDDKILHLDGTPGQVRFKFMWEILAKEMNGFIILVDSTDPGTFPEVSELAETFQNFHKVPYIVAANKQDMEGRVSLTEVRRGSGVGDDITVMPCVSIEKTSVRQVLLQIVSLIDAERAKAE
ncbi:MAG: ATP/GTP-binding protein [Anaerolineae bacterium]|nr:ATP/GTP-binding protein [Anaerolineae bacterium]